MSYLINTYINIRAFLLFSMMMTICRTLRFEVEGRGGLDELKKKGKNVLFAVWHQATFVMFYLYRHQKACILVTSETRGQILGLCARWLGFQTISVPTRKGDFEYAQSLARMLKLIREGYDAVIAVDGPAGPLHEVKPGVFYLAGKAKVPIVPIGLRAPWKITLFWRWDKYFVPLPFSPVRLRVGKAIWPEEHMTADLRKKLLRLSK